MEGNFCPSDFKSVALILERCVGSLYRSANLSLNKNWITPLCLLWKILCWLPPLSPPFLLNIVYYGYNETQISSENVSSIQSGVWAVVVSLMPMSSHCQWVSQSEFAFCAKHGKKETRDPFLVFWHTYKTNTCSIKNNTAWLWNVALPCVWHKKCASVRSAELLRRYCYYSALRQCWQFGIERCLMLRQRVSSLQHHTKVAHFCVVQRKCWALLFSAWWSSQWRVWSFTFSTSLCCWEFVMLMWLKLIQRKKAAKTLYG